MEWEVFHKPANVVCSQSCLFSFLMHGPRLPWDTCRAVLNHEGMHYPPDGYSSHPLGMPLDTDIANDGA